MEQISTRINNSTPGVEDLLSVAKPVSIQILRKNLFSASQVQFPLLLAAMLSSSSKYFTRRVESSILIGKTASLQRFLRAVRMILSAD